MLKKLTGLLVRKPRRASAAPRHDGARLALPEKLPRHVGIIMDGNGRWAQERGLPRSAGHAAGTEALRDIIQACDDWGIYALSIYAFSTENWARPKDEVGALMNLILRYFQSEIDELDEKGAVIRIIGDIDGLPDRQRETVLRAMERTKDNDGLRLNIALNYGGHAELTRAARRLAARCLRGELKPEDIAEADVESELYTAGLPPVDLLIRTSGEVRTSNFLPWQAAYAEMVFDPILWPDYTREVFLRDLHEYASRDRRFGGVKTKERRAGNENARHHRRRAGGAHFRRHLAGRLVAARSGAVSHADEHARDVCRLSQKGSAPRARGAGACAAAASVRAHPAG